MQIKVKKIRPEIEDSLIASGFDKDGDIGLPLFVLEDTTLPAFLPVRIPHGVAFEFPEGYGALLTSRSSARGKGIIATHGTIDRGYRGEVSSMFEYRPSWADLASWAADFVRCVFREITNDGFKCIMDAKVIVNIMDNTRPSLEIKKKERYTQLVPIFSPSMSVAIVNELTKTERGESGWGSTDKETK